LEQALQMNYLENITQLIPTIEAMLHVNNSTDASEQPGVSYTHFFFNAVLLEFMCFSCCSLRKAFLKLSNKPAFLSALTHEKPEAFKYSYLSKANTQQAVRK
jgi:hypothetical protein